MRQSQTPDRADGTEKRRHAIRDREFFAIKSGSPFA